MSVTMFIFRTASRTVRADIPHRKDVNAPTPTCCSTMISKHVLCPLNVVVAQWLKHPLETSSVCTWRYVYSHHHNRCRRLRRLCHYHHKYISG